MNRKIHLILVLGCVLIAVLDAPRATRLFSEGLAGPYEESARVRPLSAPLEPAAAVEPAAPGDARAARRGGPAPAPSNKTAPALLNSSVLVDQNGGATAGGNSR
ncbi:MAG: hypothetical protein L6Q99_19865 [Planctomycetes bacterium]|nr:hypothetical protein [Planctomycetota bacterium]